MEKTLFQEAREVKLGADPEFMLVNSRSGKMVAASEFPRRGIVGCDAIRSPIAARPIGKSAPPERDPQHLILNIDGPAQCQPHGTIRNVKWVAGSPPFGFSIGGHIHFSNITLNAGFAACTGQLPGHTHISIEDKLPRSNAAGRLRQIKRIPQQKPRGLNTVPREAGWSAGEIADSSTFCLAKIVVSRGLPAQRGTPLHYCLKPNRPFTKVIKNIFAQFSLDLG